MSGPVPKAAVIDRLDWPGCWPTSR